jgi:nitroimidazol reductase NimA-like FMN-containing flavoprotein (pyridoxamine 5'-phosphate oxidase superfamily)
MGEAADHPVLTSLGPDACLALLSDHGVGRVAVTTDTGPAIVPVNYTVRDGTVAFRTAPSAAPARAVGHEVAFEVDRIDEALSEGWSVLVLGTATVASGAEAEELAEGERGGPWAGGDRPLWIRVDPRRVSGRRITAG